MESKIIQDKVEEFFKVKGKYSNNADLIRRVISKTLSTIAEAEKIKISPHEPTNEAQSEACINTDVSVSADLDPRDNPLTEDDSWIHDVDMGAIYRHSC